MSETASRRKAPRVVLLFLLLAFAGWFAYRWWWGLSHVTTDNAQVEGHIVPVLPKVGGFVTAVKVTDHQPVQGGDLLLTIDDRDLKVRLAQAEAELQLALAAAGREGGRPGQAEAQVAAARAAAAAARSNIEQALANADRAQKDVERIRELVGRKMATPQALDAVEAAARSAHAQVKASRETATSAGEQVTATGAALRAALAKVESARAVRDLAANQLADTRVVAPAKGLVANKNVEPGQLVQAGQPVLSVVPLDDIWITANMKETEVRDVKPGLVAELDVDAYPGARVKGTVESISPATGARFSLLPPDNATGNFTKVVQRVPVRIRVKQSDDPQRLLRPGLSVFVTIAVK